MSISIGVSDSLGGVVEGGANKLKSVSLIRSTLSPNKTSQPPRFKPTTAAGGFTYVRVYVATPGCVRVKRRSVAVVVAAVVVCVGVLT